jgi:hypothetical protein
MFRKLARFLVGRFVSFALIVTPLAGCSPSSQIGDAKAKELADARFEQLAAASNRGIGDFEFMGVTHENRQRIFRWQQKSDRTKELVVVVFDDGGIAEGVTK